MVTEQLEEYMVYNRITKEMHEVKATSAQEACEKLGWMIGDCQVRIIVNMSRGQIVV